MPIAVDIKAQLDKKSFDNAAGVAIKSFEDAGKRAWDAFGKGMSTGGSSGGSTGRNMQQRMKTEGQKAGNVAGQAFNQAYFAQLGKQAGQTASFEQAARKARDVYARAGRQAGDAFSRNMYQAMGKSAASGGGGGGALAGALSQQRGVISQFANMGKGAGGAFIAAAGLVMGGQALVDIGVKAGKLVAAGFKSVIEQGIEFRTALNQLQGVTGANAEQMAKVRAEANALGSDLSLVGTTSASALQAITALTKGGLTMEQAMAAARGSIQLATAAQIDNARAAEIQAKALTMFGLGAEQASHVADVLATTSKAVPGTINDIAQALENAGPAAVMVGYSLEETVAILGTFIKGGLGGAEAGNALNTMFSRLLNPTEASAEAIGILGLRLRDAQGNMASARDIIIQLSDAASRLKPDVFQAAMSELFGTRGIRGGAIAAKQGTAIFDQLMRGFEQVGTAGNMASANLAGLPGILEKIDNTSAAVKSTIYDLIESFAEVAGEEMVGGFDSFADAINMHRAEIVSFFGDASTVVFGFMKVIAYQLATGTEMFGVFTKQLGDLATFAGKFINTLGAPFRALPDEVLDAMGPVGKALKAFGDNGGEGLLELGESTSRVGSELANLGNEGQKFALETLPELQERLGGVLDKVEENERANQKYREGFNDLKDAIELLPDTREVIINENTAEVRKKLDELGIKVQELPDGKLKINVEYTDAQGGMLKPPSERGWWNDTMFPGAPTGGGVGQPERGPLQEFSGAGDEKKKTHFDPSLWEVQSSLQGVFGPNGGINVPGVGEVFDSGLLRSANRVISDEERLEEAKLSLLEVRADNNATQRQILTAENNVAQAERGLLESRRGLQDDMIKYVEDMYDAEGRLKDSTRSMREQLGAALDADLGLSRGLGGLAENLVKFLGNVAAAPLLGQLQATKQIAMANAGLSESGSGLLGAFGPIVPAEGNLLDGGARARGNMPGVLPGGGAATGSVGGNVQAMMALAQGADGGKYGWGASDLVNGLADCSGAISDLVEMLNTGSTTPGRLFDTTTFANPAEAAKFGFRPGYMPGALNVGVNPYPGRSGHMAATLPNGVNFEAGGGTGGIAYGGKAAGAMDFEKQFHIPIDGMPMLGGLPASAAAGGGGSGGLGGIPIPLPVVIVGGAIPGIENAQHGGSSGAIPGPQQQGPGIGGPGGPGGPLPGGGGGGFGGTTGYNWEALMQAESGGHGGWKANTGNGYFGGLQFDEGTWNDYKLPGFPGRADLATPQQQIAAAENALRQGRTPQSLWPNTHQNLFTPRTMVPGAGPGNMPGTNPLDVFAPGGGAPGVAGIGGPGPLPGMPTGMPGAGGGTGNLRLPGQMGGPPASLNASRTNLEADNPQWGSGLWQPNSSGFQGAGGMLMAGIQSAISAAGTAGDASGGMGGGQAAAALAQMATQLINRTIGFAGQAAGIGIEGLGETFFPAGSQLGDLSQNWLFRIAGGLAGAAPQLPVLAGQGGEKPGKNKDIADEIRKGFDSVNQAGKAGGDKAEQGGAPLVGEMHVGSAQDGQAMQNELRRTQSMASSYAAGQGW